MLLIHCPYCNQTLPEAEFTYAGEAHIARPVDPSALSDEEWRDFLFIRSNPRGTHFERWRHAYGCGKWFLAARDSVTMEVYGTYAAQTHAPPQEIRDRLNERLRRQGPGVLHGELAVLRPGSAA